MNALSSGVRSHSFGVRTLCTLVSLHSHRSKDIFRWRNLLIRPSALTRITRSKQAKFKNGTGDCLVIIRFQCEFATHRKINISLGQYFSHRSHDSMMTIYLYYAWRLFVFDIYDDHIFVLCMTVINPHCVWWLYVCIMFDEYLCIFCILTTCPFHVWWLLFILLCVMIYYSYDLW